MKSAESDILSFFRRYRVGPAEMLFFSPGDCKVAASHFIAAMRSLIEQGLVVKERPDQAYSLTRAGYRVSRSCGDGSVQPPRRPAAKCHRRSPA